MLKTIIHSILFIYQFNTGNDINGVVEDQIDKPERSIPSGSVSIRKAYIHYILGVILYFTYGYYDNFFWQTFSWISSGFVINFGGLGKYGLWKKLLLCPGNYVIFDVNYCFANGITNLFNHSLKEWVFINVLTLGVIIIWPIQDLRDVKADAIFDRKTFPVVYGVKNSRKMMIIALFVNILFIYSYDYYF